MMLFQSGVTRGNSFNPFSNREIRKRSLANSADPDQTSDQNLHSLLTGFPQKQKTE